MIVYRDWLSDNPAPAAFAIATAGFYLLHRIMDVPEFYWDSGDYWRLAEFSTLINFPKEVRGYFYPFLISPIRLISDSIPTLGMLPFRLISSALYAYVLAVLLPNFWIRNYGGTASFSRRIIVPLLLAVIFPGVLVYPLTDLPALILAFAAVQCTLKAADSQGRRRTFFALFAGILAYGSYNTRPIFLFSAILLIVGIAMLIVADNTRKQRLGFVSIFLIGVLIASVPQATINFKNHGIPYPGVITTGDRINSLFATQLLWGITLQRYETSVGPNSLGAGRFFIDRTGEKFFSENQLDGKHFSIGDYLYLVASNPFDFIGLFGRHFINGMDVRDGEVYTRGASSGSDIFAFFNFCVVFFGLAVALGKASHGRIISKPSYWAMVLLIPVLAIIPGAIETRFFLPLHIALYSVIAFLAEPNQIWHFAKQRWPLILVLFIFSASAFFAVSTNTMSAMQYQYADEHRGL